MTELEQMRTAYRNHMEGIMQTFRIVEKIDFMNKITEFVKTGENVKGKEELKEWNNKFFALVINYSTLTDDQIEENLSLDMQEVMLKLKQVENEEK